VVTDGVATVCVNTVAPADTLTTATEYCVAPDEALQLSVGVRVLTVVPGGEEPPGDKPVGVAGAVATLIVKYTTAEVPLDPAEFEADTAHR
jgi:hypothetical protein